MKSRVFARTVAIAAVTALGGLGLAGLAPSASAATPAKAYDFNGDGYQDVVLGSPYGTVGTKTTAGFVSVIYGSASGLNTAKKAVISQESTGIAGNAEAGDHFGYSLASADFDEDGFADLAIGTPDEDTPSGANAGLITVIWGASGGLSTVSASYEEFNEGDAAAGNRWGETLAAGKIESTGTAKLFITIPGMSNFKWIYFVAAENARAASKRSPRLAGTQGIPRKGASVKSLQDVNNSWLASGDVTGDGTGDLVYAWNDADWSVPEERRGFIVFPGLSDGNLDFASTTGENTEVGSVAVADFDDDGFGDVAVGQPSDGVKGGQVTAYNGSAAGVSPEAKTSINRDSAGVPDTAAAGDQFGVSIAAGDVDEDGIADLAVGTPYDEVGTVVDAGSSTVLFGAAGGLSGTGSQQVTQDTEGAPGGSETGDDFGYQVTLLDTTRDGAADLTVGAVHENGSDGAITYFKGGQTDGLLPVSGALWLGTGTWGVTGKSAELGRRLGR